jgi:hypothetical protein
VFAVACAEVIDNVGSAVDVEGELSTATVAVAVSDVESVSRNVSVIAFVDATPVVAVLVADAKVRTSDCTAAGAETAENEPSVKAATATSAMRLKVVFVDICFLSIVDLENLPSSA